MKAAMLALCFVVSTAQADSSQAMQEWQEDGRGQLETFLERPNVQERLIALGLNDAVSRDRIAALTEAEVTYIAQRIDGLSSASELSHIDLVIVLLVTVLVAIAL